MTEATLNTEAQTLKNLYAANEQADLISVLGSAIQRLR